MKHVTHIIFSMLCMLCLFDATAVAQVNSSDEFFTLYFKDGTSRNFYTGDITAITHSNIDLDGTIYEEPVVQEICMGTEVERYRLSDIEEMSFERLNLPFDVRAYMKEWDDIHAVVDDLFMECDIIQELQKHKEEIQALANVKDVYFDVKQGFMEVTLNDGTSQSWDYPIYGPDDDGSSRDELFAKAESKVKALAESNANVHKPSNGKKVWIGNMLDRDQASNFVRGTKYLKELVGKLDTLGFEVVYTDKWVFSEASTSDIILFVTHGGYNESKNYHYINTGIDCSSLTDVSDYLSKPGSAISSTKINIGVKPNGEYIKDERMYFKIATQFIEEQVNLKDSAVVFMGACSTMKRNNTFARAFTKKGASSYIGFDNLTYIPAYLGAAFVYQLAKDKSVSESFDYVAKSMGEMSTDKEWPWNKYDAEEHDELSLFGGMQIQYRKDDSSYGDICFNHSSFSTAKPEDCETDGENIKLGVKIQNIENLKKKYNNDIQGIGVVYVSEDFSDSGEISIPESEWGNMISFGLPISVDLLETYYYYYAYLETSDQLYTGDVEYFLAKDVKAREELKRLYDELGGDTWKEEDKYLWFDNEMPIVTWNNVTKYSSSEGYNVDLSSVSCAPKTSISLNNYNRIYSLTIPSAVGNLEKITISNCNMLHYLKGYRATEIQATVCPELYDISVADNTEKIYVEHCNSIEWIRIVQSGMPVKLQAPNLKSLSLIGCKSLERIEIPGHEQLSELIVAGCDNVKYVNCSNCDLKTLNLKDCTNLEWLNCDANKIQRVDVSSRKLDHFTCYGNPIIQKLEEIPNYEKFDLPVKYQYTAVHDYEDDYMDWIIDGFIEDGWTVVRGGVSKEDNGRVCLMSKQSYDDGHGFYNDGEPHENWNYKMSSWVRTNYCWE